jgi:TRAP-type uncharacterized transport system substrate-binding protein
MLPRRVPTHPHTTRSRLMLEVASEMVNDRHWPYLQAKICLREQGAEDWAVTLFGSDSPATLHEVARGEVHFGVINPSMVLTMATLGKGPFKQPLPLRTIAVIPSWDQMVFAVNADTGLTSLADVRERRFPLKVSLRKQPDHSLHIVIGQVLKAAGFTLDELVSWGGGVRYDHGMPYEPHRIGAVERGEINAIFDEASESWGNKALDLGMRFLPLEASMLRQLETVGFRAATLDTARFPTLSQDIPTLDFSGWPIYTHADTDEDLVVRFCRGLQARLDRVPWEEAGALPLERMVRDTPAGPCDVPFHAAADRYWRDQGLIP